MSERYSMWAVYAPNGNMTSLTLNSIRAVAERLAENALNTTWPELEKLGFTMKVVEVIDHHPREAEGISVSFSDAKIQ